MNSEDRLQIVPARVWSDVPTSPRREALWLKEGKKCHWCGRPTRLVAGDAPDQATTEHIIPRYKGGTNDDENLVSACRQCNGRRNDEDMKGLPEGALLGSYGGKSVRKAGYRKHIALTGDEKRALLGKLPAGQGHMTEIEVVREQRDQALTAVTTLRTELERWKTAVADLEAEARAMTVGKLLRQRLARWLMGE
jgi:hypothetical protein